MPARLQLVARTGHPDFLDLPWQLPLEEWESERLVEVVRGLSRHTVRFVNYDDDIYALKEIPQRRACRGTPKTHVTHPPGDSSQSSVGSAPLTLTLTLERFNSR